MTISARAQVILALIPLVALTFAASTFVWPRGSLSRDTFTGVSYDELAADGIVVLNDSPSSTPSIGVHDVADYYTRAGVALQAARIVAVDIRKSPGGGPFGYHLAWILKLNPSRANREYRADLDVMLAFFDANTGELLAVFERYPPTVTPTAPFTMPS